MIAKSLIRVVFVLVVLSACGDVEDQTKSTPDVAPSTSIGLRAEATCRGPAGVGTHIITIKILSIESDLGIDPLELITLWSGTVTQSDGSEMSMQNRAVGVGNQIILHLPSGPAPRSLVIEGIFGTSTPIRISASSVKDLQGKEEGAVRIRHVTAIPKGVGLAFEVKSVFPSGLEFAGLANVRLRIKGATFHQGSGGTGGEVGPGTFLADSEQVLDSGVYSMRSPALVSASGIAVDGTVSGSVGPCH